MDTTRTGLVILVACVTGCSALINPDDSRLNVGPRRDAGVLVGVDAGIVRRDAGPGIDAGPGVDAGTPGDCTGTGTRCSGDVLVRCVDGFERFESCNLASAYCEAGACRPWVCDPSGRATCNESRTESQVCSPRGNRVETTACTAGRCNLATGLCESDPPPTCGDLPTVTVGSTHTIDLCERPNDNEHVRDSGSCTTTLESALGDAVFRLQIETAGVYEITLTDVDGDVPIDTIVYVRTTCDDAASQIACADDIPGCGTSEMCRSPSTIRQRFERGIYYVIADGYRYLDYECGVVQLTVQPSSVDTTP